MRESEWGKLNAGQSYGILAVDVDRALACADLGRYEQIVMQAVRERSWGTSARRKRKGEPWPEPDSARIDLKALAAELGVTWQRLYEARKWLADAKLIVSRDGGFMPNKNAVDWVNPRTGAPLLTPAQIAYAARACTRQMRQINPPTFTPECESDSRRSVNAVHTSDGIPFTQKCERNSRGSVNPHIERARVPEDPTGLDSPRVDLSQTAEREIRHEIVSTSPRPAEDMDLVLDAARILASDLRTQALGQKLLQEHNLPGTIAIEGWRWVIAARKVLEPGIADSARRSIRWLATTAANLTDADRFAMIAGVGPHVNGQAPEPVRPFAERLAEYRAARQRRYADGR